MLFIITISALFILAPERTNGGYIYPRPNTSFQLPNTESNINQQIQQQQINEIFPQPITQSVVSHSVPLQSYQDNNNLLSNNDIRPRKVNIDLTVTSLANQQNNLEINSVAHNDIPAIRIPPLNLITPSRNQESVVATFNAQQLNIPVANVPINQNNNFISETYSHVNNPSIPALNVLQPLNQQSNLEVNTVQHNDVIANRIPNTNLLAITNLQNDLGLNNVQNVDIPSLNIPTENGPVSALLQSNFEFTTQQNNNGVLNSLNIQEAVSPKIIKHVYFHAPPPEIEEPSVQIIPPKIKNVKIIVIKVSSQDNNDIGLSQRNAINQFAPIEEKTIVYVLSKKPSTPQEVFVPKPVPSEHEVFFVKYNGNVDSAVTQVNGNLEQIHS